MEFEHYFIHYQLLLFLINKENLLIGSTKLGHNVKKILLNALILKNHIWFLKDIKK